MQKAAILLGILTSSSLVIQTPTIAQAQHQKVPSYAKWGQLAIRETHSKYPNARIIDYLHQGRETKEDTTIEKFKLWLEDTNHEFGVFVTIQYQTETEKVIRIEFQRTSR